MDAREFHALALELVQGTSAAHSRTAISRAYYAAYHVGFEVLGEMGFQIPEGPGGHEEVRRHFNNRGDREVTRVASQLGDLFTRRIHADYRLSRPDVENQATARMLVEQAQRMIEALARCRGEPKRSQLVGAIQEWKRKISAAGG